MTFKTRTLDPLLCGECELSDTGYGSKPVLYVRHRELRETGHPGGGGGCGK